MRNFEPTYIPYARRYLKSLFIHNTHIEFTTVEKDKETSSSIQLQDIRIRIVELVFSVHRPGRDFKLQIDVKQNGKFETVFEQYQIGKWNKTVFDEIFSSYCEAKKIPHKKTMDMNE